MTSLVSFLKAIDWPIYQGRYGLCFEEANVKDMLQHTKDKSLEHLLELLHTRCLFSSSLAAFILNRHDLWVHASVESILSPGVVAASVEIDVTDILDHMFVVFKDPGTSQWWIIQSYINRYTAKVEPVDIIALINTIKQWMVQGVRSDEWESFFHVPMTSSNRCHPHVFIIERYNAQDINTFSMIIDQRFNSMTSGSGSYLSFEPFKSMALEQ